MRNYFNWKNLLVLIAAIIAVAALYFANNLTKKLAREEKKRVELISQAIESTIKSNGEQANIVESKLIADNTTIPLIWTDANDVIIDAKNINPRLNADDRQRKIESIKASHPRIIINILDQQQQFIYYGESELLRQLRFFPYILLVILFLFLIIVASFINTSGRQIQDRVWVGMSKETAHQLGTPLTSLVGWIEYLKSNNIEAEAMDEMQKDVERLQLIADRFSKIGSQPKLEQEQLLERLDGIVWYMQKRASKNVRFFIESNKEEVLVVISGALFDWVIENLIRNALDAMDGKGEIRITVKDEVMLTYIDISDTGKGIENANIKKVFKPGFSTKKRGWGLGLSLSKRIMSEYHYGDIYVKKSEIGKGTTFRIELKR
jgi:signal transduction histidine kinase